MNYKIISDSSCDLISLDGVEFDTVPLKLLTDEREYVDDVSLDVPKMVAELGAYKGRSGSSCPNFSEWQDAFRGADHIFAITISSALSGSCDAARNAAIAYESENPGTHIFVIDSLSAGPELALIVEKLRELILAGVSYIDICEQIVAYQRHTHIFFALESLSNLAKNGRVSKTAAAIAGVLGIRLLGQGSETGTLEPIVKCRGEVKTLAATIENMRLQGYNGGKIRIAHCLNERAAERLRALLVSTFGEADITIYPTRGLCSYYAERGGILIGFETP